VTLRGWLRTIRVQKNDVFLTLNDGSSFHGIQVVAQRSLFTENSLKGFATGCSVRVEGKLTSNPSGEGSVELLASRAPQLVGACDQDDYPLQKKFHSAEFLRSVPHMRPRSNLISSNLRVRSHAAHAIHQFFNREGFCLMHTPILTPLDCEGAGELFAVT
jgi:asparaginyl-tRNA synthetase